MRYLVEMLQEARSLIAESSRAEHGRTRSAAILARQALEEAVILFMENNHDKIGRPDFNAILIVLEELASEDERPTIRDIAWTWSALSNACHAHAYSLEPTPAEVEGWLESIEKFLRLSA